MAIDFGTGHPCLIQKKKRPSYFILWLGEFLKLGFGKSGIILWMDEKKKRVEDNIFSKMVNIFS